MFQVRISRRSPLRSAKVDGRQCGSQSGAVVQWCSGEVVWWYDGGGNLRRRRRQKNVHLRETYDSTNLLGQSGMETVLFYLPSDWLGA